MTKKKEGAKMGRPPMDPEDVRSIFLAVRVTRREQARLLAEAQRRGISYADLFMRPWRKKGGAK